MASVDELIDAIILKNPGVSRETILKRLEEEREKSGGLISDEVLLRVIAAEFGVKTSNVVSVPSLVIGSLVPGLNDVSVTGRVIATYPSWASGKDLRSKFASVLVADRSGSMRVVLWNDKAELVNSGKIRPGQALEFYHGYTKEGRGGRVELHIGEKGGVKILDEKAAENYPTILELSTRIGAITSALKNRRINLTGKVRQILHESTFQRKDSTAGKVLRFILADETGEIPVVAWNKKADEVQKILGEGVMLQVVNAKVKAALNGKMEVHADRETYVDVLTLLSKIAFWKIAELKEGMGNVNVQGTVTTKPIKRKVKTSKGETVELTVFEIEDETGRIWVSAWRKNAEKTLNLKPGEKIAIKNAYVKRGFGGQLEISTRNMTTLEIL
ncbi:MAG: OB-fold nucleic acid binding domain-containing protein [Candidatus Bathyarchaeota archaeon]|nr:OB-fold nucleic acid binding domain-containing protein [Candidatus Bathyarchaeota archaeon]MDW8040738.1 OB-fold nucleic acid binding domain-containing protein [Nitrososphaerota archaeon]